MTTKIKNPAWEKLKGESSKAFERFKIYRDLPPESRSLEKVREILKEKLTKIDKKASEKNNILKIPSLTTLSSMSSNWNWVERAELYDHYRNLQEVEENEADFKKTNEEFKGMFKDSLGFASQLLNELKENLNGNALSTRLGMFHTLMNVMDTLYKNYRLACGRSTTISERTVDATVEANVDAKIEDLNKVDMGEDELEELLTINDDFEEFTDEL